MDIELYRQMNVRNVVKGDNSVLPPSERGQIFSEYGLEGGGVQTECPV